MLSQWRIHVKARLVRLEAHALLGGPKHNANYIFLLSIGNDITTKFVDI